MSDQPIQVPTLQAVRFHRPIASGRTKPCLLACIDPAGGEHDIVAKFGGPELSVTAMVCELMAALLAQDLGLATPDPVIVRTEGGFHTCVPTEFPESRRRIEDSQGLNYGSIHLGTGVATWPVGQRVPPEMLSQAADVFAFDAIVMNPDRRQSNPNLLQRKNVLFVYDHELAFSFLRSIMPGDDCPWQRGVLSFLGQHVFGPALRKKPIDWQQRLERFARLPDRRLASYVAAVPPAWDPGERTARRIVDYLIRVRGHVDDLALNLTEVLA
jgi:hypothetical protein